jgi:uncharacterized membrane protein
MSTLAIIGLSLLAILVITGIIRVIFKPSDSVLDFILDILWLDLLFDLLGGIFEALGDIDFD